MTESLTERASDVIVVGAGHNGMVAAAYLARAGLEVRLFERRSVLGGPCGAVEFIPGYRAAFSNSPGSLEPTVVDELGLPEHGLRFVRPDPTLVHPFDDMTFLSWRDRTRLDQQLDRLAPGESKRYRALIAFVDDLGRKLGISLFEAPPTLRELVAGMRTPEDEHAFGRAFLGSLEDLLDDFLRSKEAKALIAMLAVNAQLLPPSSPGSASGLLLRPLSLASRPATDRFDPSRAPLRGSVGLPVGSMGAIVDALESACRSAGVALHRETGIARILRSDDAVVGVLTDDGDEYTAPVVLSAVSPSLLARQLLDDGVGGEAIEWLRRTEVRGSAFKIALGLDRLPDVRNLPDDVDAARVLRAQFRIAPSVGYIESAILDGLAGRASAAPIMWGLVPSLTSPGLAPPDRHLMSVNVWHAPRDLAEGDWSTQRDRFGTRCIEVLERYLPGLTGSIVDHRFIGPDEIENELGLVGSNITHGDMNPGRFFGFRPHPLARDYRGPLRGLYLTGAGTWPGGYVTGIPGRNASRAVLADVMNQRNEDRPWNS